MKRTLFTCLCVCLLLLPMGQIEAYTIELNSSSIVFDNSWDTPAENIFQVLENRYGTSDNTLTLVNGINGDEIESWTGNGVYTLMLEEIAGYAQETDFGWYEVGQSSPPPVVSELFPGSAMAGATAMVQFTTETNFGFYIDPNGEPENRMYTEHLLNSHLDYQVTVWRVNGSPYDFILGWEDLDLNGDSGGDRDYQDMIVSLRVDPVPESGGAPISEPTTMLLLGAGLVGLIGFRRRFKES